MRDSHNYTTRPTVSIILPTFNRARFLPQAFESIQSQTFTDWELIVVDDGSTDETPELVQELTASIRPPVNYVWQDNQGAYGARNTGLDHARGRYIAFFDSDDEWLPHHLADCVAALERSSEVDWVYSACRIVEGNSDKVVAEHTFYVDGQPRPFMSLRCRQVEKLHIIEDPDAISKILRGAGLFAGLQNSLIRQDVLQERFHTEFRNEAEDQLVVLRALAQGRNLGYLDNVHVVYRIHEGNSSATKMDGSLRKQIRIYRAMAKGFEALPRQVSLSAEQQRALNTLLSEVYFWQIGYALLWRRGHDRKAMRMFRRGLRLNPRCFSYWKTYMWANIRHRFRLNLVR